MDADDSTAVLLDDARLDELVAGGPGRGWLECRWMTRPSTATLASTHHVDDDEVAAAEPTDVEASEPEAGTSKGKAAPAKRAPSSRKAAPPPSPRRRR
jgi:hypothetical protein